MPTRRILATLWLLLALLLAVHAHRPALDLGFNGDDYEWWQHARMALREPRLLLSAYGGYRPVNTWTLAADHLVHGHDRRGYHLTNLLLHLGCGVLLWRLLNRLDLSPPGRFAVTALWLCSPWVREPVWWPSNRFELILLLGWLAMALAWPGPGQRFGRRRLAAVAALGIVTAFTKETWVILPALTVLYDLVLAGVGPRRALARAAAPAAAVLAYLALYRLAGPLAASDWFRAGPAGAAKVPHVWAAFAAVTDLVAGDFPLGPAELGALAVMAGLGWLAWRRSSRLMALGFGLYLLPFLPILPVGWLSTRYTTVPYLGFLLVAAGAARELVGAARGTARNAARAAIGLLAVLYLAAGLARLASDVGDERRYARALDRLVREAEAFLPELPRDRALVAVRLERLSPLAELAGSVEGVAKAYYVRGADPYGLIAEAALWSWVADRDGGPIFVAAAPGPVADRPYAVVGHGIGGFGRLDAGGRSLGEALAFWPARGPTRLLLPWRP
jgi:hypothetical protein